MLERIARVGRRLGCRLTAACILVAGALLGGPGACHAAVIGGAAPPLRVMTFNVLHSSVRNPIGSWRVRRPRVVRTIRAARPDIACLQEVSDLQLADLTRDLPEYEILPGAPSGATTAPRWVLLFAAALAAGWLALGARARRARPACRFLRAAALTAALLAFAAVLVARFVLGGFLDSGERCPILLLRGRVAGAALGSFWVSPDPERPGSTLPGSPTPHVVNRARVADLRGGPGITVFNTHLGLAPWEARRTADALLARLDREWNGGLQILAGDFNAAPRGALVRALIAGRDRGAPPFHDAWSEAERREGNGATYRWGTGGRGARIDYVLMRPPTRALSAAILEPRPAGEVPSDHLPLLVELAPVRRISE